MLYGLLVGEIPVLIPNATGLFASTYCILIYEMNSSAPLPYTYIVGLAIIAVGLMFASAADSFVLGLMGDFLAVLMMGSPLATLMTVIREQSTQAMPFATSLATFGNGLSWSLYGLIIANDPLVKLTYILITIRCAQIIITAIQVYGPNLAGVVLSSAQLGLFAVYGIQSM